MFTFFFIFVLQLNFAREISDNKLNGRVLLEKLIVAQLVNKFTSFMERAGSLSLSQQPVIGTIRSQVNPIHILQIYFPKVYYNVILTFMPMFSDRSFSNQDFLLIAHLPICGQKIYLIRVYVSEGRSAWDFSGQT